MIKIRIILLSLLLGLFSNCERTTNVTDIPEATLKGYIKGISSEDNDLNITIHNSVIGDHIIYQLPIDPDGKFELSMPLAFPVVAGVESKYIGIYPVSLSPNETSYLNIDIDSNKQSYIQIVDKLDLSIFERSYLYEKMLDILMNTGISKGISSILKPASYQEHMTNRIKIVLSQLDIDSVLPSQGKELIKKEINLFYTQNILMNYKSYMTLIAKNYELEEDKEIEEPDISYYSFLKDLNLSDSSLISTSLYHTLLHDILQNPVFEVVAIDELSPSSWITSRKEKLVEVVGENQTLFYDMLLANSYSSQLNQMQSFSEKQIENIKSHYKESDIAKVLLSENHKINVLLRENEHKRNTGPLAKLKKGEEQNIGEAEVFMNWLFDKYKDKIIVVDFWATWCGPCIKSINEIKSLKRGISKKDVIFVYITTESSPPKTWEIMKREIEGEHYYLDEKTWSELFSLYNFNSIPTILVFDRNNKMTEKIDGYKKDDERLINSLRNLF